MSNITILILAAGTSSRMGKIKQLLPYRHTTLLGWAIEQAQGSKAQEILCVLGADAEKIGESIKNYCVKTVYNPDFGEGLSTSIVCGIKKLLKKDAVLVMLADQPLITSAHLDSLIYQFLRSPRMIIASAYRSSPGVPAIFPQKYFDQLLQLKGDKGAKEFLKNNSDEVLLLPIDQNLIDIDTQEDYKKLKQ